MDWTEGHVHVAMRRFLRKEGWLLVAGEFPGGSDHELYPLNVVDPTVARDRSPDPRRHSVGELIPDLVALKGRDLLLCEAKVAYDERDRLKLANLVGARAGDLLLALRKFSDERGFPALQPIESLALRPVLAFLADGPSPQPPSDGLSYLVIGDQNTASFQGAIAQVVR